MKINTSFFLLTGGFVNIILLALATSYQSSQMTGVKERFATIDRMLDSIQFEAEQLAINIDTHTTPADTTDRKDTDMQATPDPIPLQPEPVAPDPLPGPAHPATPDPAPEVKRPAYNPQYLVDTISRLEKLRYRLKQSLEMLSTYTRSGYQYRDAASLNFFYTESFLLVKKNYPYLSGCLSPDEADTLTDYLSNWIDEYHYTREKIKQRRDEEFGLRPDDAFVINNTHAPFPKRITQKIFDACNRYRQLIDNGQPADTH